jgi:hypothetical protein
MSIENNNFQQLIGSLFLRHKKKRNYEPIQPEPEPLDLSPRQLKIIYLK